MKRTGDEKVKFWVVKNSSSELIKLKVDGLDSEKEENGSTATHIPGGLKFSKITQSKKYSVSHPSHLSPSGTLQHWNLGPFLLKGAAALPIQTLPLKPLQEAAFGGERATRELVSSSLLTQSWECRMLAICRA